MTAPIKMPGLVKVKLHPTIQELDWENILGYAENYIKDELERRNTIEAIKILKEKLGHDFIRRAKRNAPDFMWNFIFISYWSKFTVISLANQISALENEQNFDVIISSLRCVSDKGRFHEALTLMDTAFLFKNGFQINFAPKTPGFNKCPDIGIKNSIFKEEILVEVSELQESEEREEGWKVMSIVFPQYFIELGLHSFGRLKKPILAEQAQEILNKIHADIAENRNRGLWHINKEDWFDYIAFAPEHQSEAEELAKELGIKTNRFEGPPLESSELERMVNKMLKKQRQLPANRINLLTIWAKNAIFDARYNETQLGHIIDLFLQKYTHISGVILLGKFPNESFVIERKSDIRILKSSNNLFYYYYGRFRDSTSEIEKLITESISHERIA